MCLEFDKEKLLLSFAGKTGFRNDEVTYRLVDEVEKDTPRLATWPFLKRKAFEDVGEFRIIYESKTEDLSSKHVQIDLAAVCKVTLSPWLPESVAESVTDIIKGIEGCEGIRVNRSSLINNRDGKRRLINSSRNHSHVTRSPVDCDSQKSMVLPQSRVQGHFV